MNASDTAAPIVSLISPRKIAEAISDAKLDIEIADVLFVRAQTPEEQGLALRQRDAAQDRLLQLQEIQRRTKSAKQLKTL